jgi:hemoglobin
MNNKDIEKREDVQLLVTAFYKKVIPDPVIGFFFTEIVQLSWEKHIPVMVDFWESLLLGTASYSGNPMAKHFPINKISPLKPEHFQRWLLLWKETLSQHFSGPVADEAFNRAAAIAGLMQHKMEAGNQ